MVHQEAASYITRRNETLFLSQKKAEKERIRKREWVPEAKRGGGLFQPEGPHLQRH